jgi:outer membrane lipoprotein carrier protein
LKYIFIITLLFTSLFSGISKLNSFSANFLQTITDETGKTLSYRGSIKAVKPQFATWKYEFPVEKHVFINAEKIVIVEPELEQVIIKNIDDKFDFFSMIKDAKKVDNNFYIAHYKDTKFNIKIINSIIQSITYTDEFGNKIEIIFTNQLQNAKIEKQELTPSYPLNYDIVRG